MNDTSDNSNCSDKSDDVLIRKCLTLGSLYVFILTRKKVTQKKSSRNLSKPKKQSSKHIKLRRMSRGKFRFSNITKN